ncbi:MAG: RlmE family RNA methyltransferase [Deltaproteobacteria bacterium]|nr:RlmE family RNA methyltransferase [Deltaproteobacteria bacterium]
MARSRKPDRRKSSGDPRADHYFYKAKDEGFAARSVYKLEEIDRRDGLLRAGMRVLDLGCAPGSWTQYAARRVGPTGFVLGIDRTPCALSLPNARTVTADLLEETPGGDEPFDVVLSDMAPATSGIRDVDEARSLELVRAAAAVAAARLAPGGSFVAKIFQGPDTKALVEELRAAYRECALRRPKATRSESREIFLVCREFRGRG